MVLIYLNIRVICPRESVVWFRACVDPSVVTLSAICVRTAYLHIHVAIKNCVRSLQSMGLPLCRVLEIVINTQLPKTLLVRHPSCIKIESKQIITYVTLQLSTWVPQGKSTLREDTQIYLSNTRPTHKTRSIALHPP